MIPIIPILAWTGGIAAGAQVAGGVVRGVGQLVRGRPLAAAVEVVDGLVGPVRLACEGLSKLGQDAYTAVMGRSVGMSHTEAPPRKPRRRKLPPAPLPEASVNGVPSMLTDRQI